MPGAVRPLSRLRRRPEPVIGDGRYPQAQFISSHGCGFLLEQPQLARFRLDSDRSDAWSVSAASPSLSYLVAPGRPARAIAALTAVSGRQSAPPAWALQPMLDRLVKNFGETQADYESNLHQDIANIDRYRLPLGAYRIEGWGFPNSDNDGFALHSFADFATQSQIIRQLRARHIHPLAYLRPWITPGSAPDHAGTPPVVLQPCRLLGHPGISRIRERQLPRRRGHQLGSGVRIAIAGTGRAQHLW